MGSSSGTQLSACERSKLTGLGRFSGVFHVACADRGVWFLSSLPRFLLSSEVIWSSNARLCRMLLRIWSNWVKYMMCFFRLVIRCSDSGRYSVHFHMMWGKQMMPGNVLRLAQRKTCCQSSSPLYKERPRIQSVIHLL